jgi:hypothetical protein
MTNEPKEKRIVYYLFEQYTQTITKKVRRINSGGCGIFAEYLYKVFIGLGLSPKLVVITNDVEQMNTRIEYTKTNGIDAWELRNSIIKHIMVYVGGKYIDCEGLYDCYKLVGYSKTDSITDLLSIEVLEIWNKDTTIWNETFNRVKNTKLIEKKFKEINEKVVQEFA